MYKIWDNNQQGRIPIPRGPRQYGGALWDNNQQGRIPIPRALGNMGVRGHPFPNLPPNPPSKKPFTAIFYTPFLTL